MFTNRSYMNFITLCMFDGIGKYNELYCTDNYFSKNTFILRTKLTVHNVVSNI